MNILAIDPGTTESAFVIYNSCQGEIYRHEILPNEEVLQIIESEIYDELAIEMIASYGMPVGKEVFETCLWIGRYIQAAKTTYQLIYRKDVKMFLCGSTKARDGNIRQALIDLLGAPGTKKNPGKTYKVKDDEWAALAVAVTYDNFISDRN